MASVSAVAAVQLDHPFGGLTHPFGGWRKRPPSQAASWQSGLSRGRERLALAADAEVNGLASRRAGGRVSPGLGGMVRANALARDVLL